MTTFSVIIPTYNRKEPLRKTLASVAAQTYRSFEVIISDDGSTDGTQDVVESFRECFPLTYIWNPNWGAPARPRNLAIAKATGEWLAFLDSDDLWTPDKLETILHRLQDCDVVYHAVMAIDSNGTARFRIDAPQIDRSNPFRDLMLRGNRLVTSATCVQRSVVQAVGGFREDKSIYVGEDFDLWLRLAKNGYRFQNLDEVLGSYISGDDNISKLTPKYADAVRQVIRDNGKSLSSLELRISLQYTNYVFGMTEYRNNNSGAALNHFLRCIFDVPTITSLKAIIRILAPKSLIEKAGRLVKALKSQN